MASQQVPSSTGRDAAKSFWRRLTFLEMSIIAVVAGLAIGGTLKILQSAEEGRRAEASTGATHALAERALQAIMTFARANGRLPCAADQASAGQETAACGTEGTLPYRALGLPDDAALDGFGNPFFYRIDPGCSVFLVSRGRDGKLGGGSGDDIAVARSPADLGLSGGACTRP